MAAHTPGPWRIATSGQVGNQIEADSGKRGNFGGVEDAGYRGVALFMACCASDRYDEQQANALANARLIAAAPELLEALANLLAVVRGDGGTQPDAQGMAERAIAKATQP